MHSVLKGAQCARRTRLVCTPQAVPCVQGVWNRLCQICLHQKKFLTLFKTPAAGTRHATCFAKGRDRTQNLRIPSPALCQLHYKPDKSDCTTCLLIHWGAGARWAGPDELFLGYRFLRNSVFAPVLPRPQNGPGWGVHSVHSVLAVCTVCTVCSKVHSVHEDPD